MVGSAPTEHYGEHYFEGPLAEWHRLSLPTFEAFLRESAADDRPGRVLDLGCGEGVYGPILASLGGEVTGCDGSDIAVRRAAARGCYRRLLRLDLDRAVLSDFDGPYDLVFSSEVIEHVAAERRFFGLIADGLRPNGLLVLTTTSYHLYLFYYLEFAAQVSGEDCREFFKGCFDDEAADRFVRKLWSLTGGHYHGFRVRRLKTLLKDAGLKVERWRYAHVQPVYPPAGAPTSPRPQRWLRAAVRVLRVVGPMLESLCRKTDLYGPNIMLAARKLGTRGASISP